MRRPSTTNMASVLLVCLSATMLVAQESPYVELQDREVKALSDQQVEDLLAGRGMGMALAAELNGYPGPKHVLELAGELDLTETQAQATQDVFDGMQAAAIEIGREIVERERLLDQLFAEREIEPQALGQATEVLGRLNGQLRGVHLAAHLAMVEILSPQQRMHYDAVRGYAAGMAHDPSHHQQ